MQEGAFDFVHVNLPLTVVDVVLAVLAAASLMAVLIVSILLLLPSGRDDCYSYYHNTKCRLFAAT